MRQHLPGPRFAATGERLGLLLQFHDLGVVVRRAVGGDELVERGVVETVDRTRFADATRVESDHVEPLVDVVADHPIRGRIVKAGAAGTTRVDEE